MFNLHEHSIIGVCELLHGYFTGSGDPVPPEEVGPLVQWLEWRVLNAWESRAKIMPAYDSAVHQMALAVINEYWGTEMVK